MLMRMIETACFLKTKNRPSALRQYQSLDLRLGKPQIRHSVRPSAFPWRDIIQQNVEFKAGVLICFGTVSQLKCK